MFLFDQSILVFTAVDYSGNSYADYNYPSWANAAGWVITMSSVSMIPLVALIKICREEGSLVERIRTLVQPRCDWGPPTRHYHTYNKPKQQNYNYSDIINHENEKLYNISDNINSNIIKNKGNIPKYLKFLCQVFHMCR